VSRTKKKVATKRQGRGKYPKYEVKNDTLVRIGWSKKEKREYTHKVSQRVFYETVEVMGRLAQGGAGPFMAEKIIEQANNAKSETIPSYQVYVVLGLLRQTNCIKQVGREGYDIPPKLMEKAEGKWSELSNRKK